MKRSWQMASAMALLLAVVGLPLLGHWVRRGGLARCALDGLRIEPVYAVSVTDGRGRMNTFCCIRCAQYWMDRMSLPAAHVEVTDEVTGRRIDSALAYFVRSRVVTTPSTGNRIHAFATAADAQRHRSEHRGRLLTGKDRPVQAKRRGVSPADSSPLLRDLQHVID